MKTVKLQFEEGLIVELPVLNVIDNESGKIESVSNMVPEDDSVIIIAHQKPTLFSVIGNTFTNTAIGVKYYLGSISTTTCKDKILKLDIGDRVRITSSDYLMSFEDSINKYSPSKIKHASDNDPNMVIANNVMRSKDKSKFGLNIQSDADINSIKDALQRKEIENGKGALTTMYKDSKVDVVSYYIAHRSAILAKIME